jgi:hypothetical protein
LGVILEGIGTMEIQKFENQLDLLKKNHDHGSFVMADLNVPSNTVITDHFRQFKGHQYGVYIVRQKITQHILYIGKAGTINQKGVFGKQDIPKRLKNVKGNNKPSNIWFLEMMEAYGRLIVEYILLNETPHSPALVEGILLQAYLNENDRLPEKNSEL